MKVMYKSLSLAGAVMFTAIGSVQVANGAEKICDIKTANKMGTSRITTAKEIFEWRNKVAWEFPELKSTREIYGEYRALRKLILEHKALRAQQLPSETKEVVEQLRREMVAANSREQTYRALKHTLKDLEKLQRLSFISDDRYLDRSREVHKLMNILEEEDMLLSERLRRGEWRLLKLEPQYDIYARVTRDKNMNSSTQENASIGNSRKGGTMLSFFRSIKNGLKALLPNWLALW